MGFANPLLLVGLLSVAVPIVIHLIHRQRAKRVRFPAIAFLLRSNEELARRLKIKQLLLLAARIGIFVLLPLAMAQPFVRCGATQETASDRLPTAVVIIVDDSASMSYVSGRRSDFELAQREARRVVDDLRPWDQVALVWAHDPPSSPINEPVEERGPVEREIAQHEVTDHGSDLPSALALAREIHMTHTLPARRTVVITDDADHAWTEVNTDPATLAGLGDVQVITVGDEARRNIAIEHISASPATDGAAGSYWIDIDLSSYGYDAQEVAVTLAVDGQDVGTALVAVSGEGPSSAGFTHIFSGGSHTLEARIDEPEGIATDNRYASTLQLDRALRVLLVNGDAHGVGYNDELFYVSHAVEATAEGSRRIEATTVTPSSFATASLADYEVIVMANVATLPTSEIQRIERFVEGGGGLLMTAGDQVDPDRWNALYGELLPKPVRSVTVLCDREDPDANIKATHLGATDATHPIFRVFDLPGGESLQSVAAYSYVLLEPSPEDEARVLASYGDGGPALLERTVGQGRVLLLTTTIDDGWSDLPIRTAFVPLLHRMLSYLARHGGRSGADVTVGERTVVHAEELEPDRVIVIDPAGQRHVLEGEGGNVGFVPEHVGLHRVSVTIGDDDVDVPALAFAAHVAPDESDPARVDPARRELFVAAAREGTLPAAEGFGAGRARTWPVVLFLLLVLFYAESLLSVRRRLWAELRRRVSGDRRQLELEER